MLVTNLTAHCFVLSLGVVLEPNGVDEDVPDADYQRDTTLNAQLDSLEQRGLISITGKPSDPFQDHGVTLAAVDAQTTPLVVQAVAGQAVDLIDVYDVDAALLFQVLADGSVLSAHSLYAAHDQGYIELDDSGFNTMFLVTKTGGKIHQREGGNPILELRASQDNTFPSTSLFQLSKSNGDETWSVVVNVRADGNVVLPLLPTSDPHVAGALWNNANTVKVSAG